MVTVLGLDGAGRHGWVGVVVAGGRFVRAVVGTLDDVLAAVPEARAVGIDIPIGAAVAGPTDADVAARARLGRRAATLFHRPPASVLDLPSQADANAWLAARGLPKLSAQAWALVPRIREATALAAHDPRLVEVHPELSFGALAGSGVLASSKKSWAGMRRRVGLLAAAGIEVPDDLGPAGVAATDDVLDAAAVAWTALRYVAGRAVPTPDPPPPAVDGIPAPVIWT